MPNKFEDVWRWPISRYVREVVASQPEGRLWLFAAKLNSGIGVLIAASLLFIPLAQHLAWVHVVLFLGMPLVGFIWFIRDMPSPTHTAFERDLRRPWQRKVDFLFQLFPALLPWVVLVKPCLS